MSKSFYEILHELWGKPTTDKTIDQRQPSGTTYISSASINTTDGTIYQGDSPRKVRLGNKRKRRDRVTTHPKT
jgi:hypothetical protein